MAWRMKRLRTLAVFELWRHADDLARDEGVCVCDS